MSMDVTEGPNMSVGGTFALLGGQPTKVNYCLWNVQMYSAVVII